MPNTLKALVAKLKIRRKSRLWRRRMADKGHEEDVAEQANALTDQMADMSLQILKEDSAITNTQPQMSRVFGSKDFKCDFQFLSIYREWPGPSYDEHSQFAPGIFDKPRHPKRRPRQKSSKRRLSHDDRGSAQRRDERKSPAATKPVARHSRTSKWPQYHGSPPPRSPPGHLLNLPGEIRNEIYRLICLSDDPIIAQFRTVIKPKQGRKNLIRRLPLEPSISKVCHQLQSEVLSLFYGENKFVFRRSEHPTLNGHRSTLTMTRADVIRKWAPQAPFSHSLRHVDVQFRARDPTFRSFDITYIFKKLANGRVDVTRKVEQNEYCMCFEDFVLDQVHSDLEGGAEDMDLLTIAADFASDRIEALQTDKHMTAEFPYSTYRPNKAVCDDCGLELMREVASGL